MDKVSPSLRLTFIQADLTQEGLWKKKQNKFGIYLYDDL